MGANAQTSVPLFTAGEVLTAVNQNLSAGTGVPVFATTVTRDAAFGGAGEKVLAEGQLAYIEASNVVQYYDGAAWATVGPSTAGGLTLVSATTIGSAVSSVTVSSAFSSTFDNYRITLNGGVASGNITISLKLGSTATGYFSFGVFGFANSATVNGLNSNNSSSWGACWTGETTNLSGFCDLYSPNLAKTTGISSWRPAHAVGTAQYVFTGFENSTTQHTAFTVSADSGTMTGGTIRVYGYQNS